MRAGLFALVWLSSGCSGAVCPGIADLELAHPPAPQPSRTVRAVEGREVHPLQVECGADRAACQAALKARIAGRPHTPIVQRHARQTVASAKIGDRIVQRTFPTTDAVAAWITQAGADGTPVQLIELETVEDLDSPVALTTEIIIRPGRTVEREEQRYRLQLRSAPSPDAYQQVHARLRRAGLTITRFQPTKDGVIAEVGCTLPAR